MITFSSVCCLQDLTELQKERQGLERQHQQEVNKLNQELQQARTLHNALQAQADKVNTHIRYKIIHVNKANKPSNMYFYPNTFTKIKPLKQICTNAGNLRSKWYSVHIVYILVHMSALFFQLFPVSLSYFPLSSLPLSFSWDLYYLYWRSINLSHFFSHACLLPLLFSLTLCFTLLLSVLLFSFLVLFFSPALLSASSSPPLGFSPVERLSSEGNDSVTVQNALVREAWNKLITCNLCVRDRQSSHPERREGMTALWGWRGMEYLCGGVCLRQVAWMRRRRSVRSVFVLEDIVLYFFFLSFGFLLHEECCGIIFINRTIIQL